MAEALAAIGAIASIVQLADFGFKLSVKLFAFGEAVANADRSVKSLANEISLTATVLRELSEVIKSNENHVSPRAVEATEKTIKECFDVFEELSKALEKSVGDVSSSKDGSEKKKVTKIERIKWSFFQPRMDLLRSNLDRLKSSLTLMLQVLAYAQSIKKQEASSKLEYQKTTIEALVRSANNADVKYQALRKAIKGTAEHDQLPEPMSRATTFVARSITSNSQDELSAPTARTASRSIDTSLDDAKIEKVGTADASPHEDPLSDNKPLVGELILCFNLVHNLLSYHLGVASNPSAYKTYLTLRRSVESAHEAELELLEKQHGDTAYVIGAEAAKNAVLLQRKLRELARQRPDPVSKPGNGQTAPRPSEDDSLRHGVEGPPHLKLPEERKNHDPPDESERIEQKDLNRSKTKEDEYITNSPARPAVHAMVKNVADSVVAYYLERALNEHGEILNFKFLEEAQIAFFDCKTLSAFKAAVGENPYRVGENELWVEKRSRANKMNTSERDRRPFTWASGRRSHHETTEEDHNESEVQGSPETDREEELLHLEQSVQEMDKASETVSTDLSNQHALVEPVADEPYDPYIPRPGQTSRTSALQAEIDATVGVMRDNISKVSERGERLDSLDDKTDNLAVSAQGFRRGANRVRRRMWMGQFAGPAGTMVDSISAGASVVAGGLQSVGNSIANAFTGPEVTQVADDATSNTVLSDFERYEDAINRLDGLVLGLQRPMDDDEGEEDENDDEQGRDVTQKLLAEWTTLDRLNTQ